MPRKAREKSSTNIYHVMLRGINRQTIFEDDEDNEKFLQILDDFKKICEYKIYGYCLMGNHVHLLLKEGKEELDKIFKRIGTSYVYWYNWKYNRCGHLFQDRFKSEVVEDDKYLVTVLRYIHQNPIKAGICETLDEYKWSSYNEYINKDGIVNYDFVLGIIGVENFCEFMNEKSDEICLEISNGKKIKDDELIKEIEKRFNIKALMIQNDARDKTEQLLKEILGIERVSTRQLSRVTGISTNIIWRL